jgi:hypothetical protein
MSTRIFYPVHSKDFVPSCKGKHAFNDARLENRYCKIVSELERKKTCIVGQLFSNWSEQLAAYRFFNNVKVDLPELIWHSTDLNPNSFRDKHILAVIDGSSIGLTCKKKHAHKHRSQIGVIDDNRTPGFYVYPCLLLEKHSHQVLGLGDVCVYTRPHSQLGAQANEEQRKLRSQLPFDEKESSVWSLIALNVAEKLSLAASVTFVMDRGADIYEMLEQLTANQQEVLVRVQHDRLGYTFDEQQTQRLSLLLAQQSYQTCRLQPIRALCHKSKSSGKFVRRQARTAKLELRYIQFNLKPIKAKGEIKQSFWVVQVVESATSVPKGESPIQWTLLTSKSINNVEQAWQLVDDYQARWWIEQLFRALKKDGIDIENIELENPEAIKKYTVMALKASAEALKLVAARDGGQWIDIQEMFDGQEQAVLEELNPKLEGNSDKSKNPHDRKSLAWAAWIIARLGGWKGYQSQRPPGPTIMTRGLEKFKMAVWLKQPPS